MTTIGYVGLGNMGGALALRLKERLKAPLLVHDRNPAAEERLAAAGARPCRAVTELARECDVILMSLPTSEHVSTALLGEGAIASNARSGTVIIDQTTGDPSATRTMAAELAGMGLQLVVLL